jgi:hypothetical protein
MFKVSSETQGKLLDVNPYWIKRIISLLQNRRKAEWQGRIRPKQDQSPGRQTLKPISSYIKPGVIWAPKYLGNHIPIALPLAAHMASLLDWLHWLPTVFLGRHSMFLTSLTSYGLHCCLAFTLTASCIVLSGATCREPDLGTHFLVFPLKSGWKPP